MSKDDAYLLEMLEAARTARAFHGECGEAEFIANPILQSAVMMQLVVIGENANKVSTAFRDAHPGIPWKAMYGMRNVIAHSYGTVKLDIVWTALTEGIPALIRDLAPLVPPDDGIEPPTKLSPREGR